MVSVGWGPIFAIYFIVFVDFLQLSFLFPLYPMIVQGMGDPKNAATMIGTLGSVSAIGEGIAAPYLGMAADKYGRKPIFMLAMTGCAISTIITGLTTTYWPLMIARLVAGICGGTASVACAYIADVTTQDERPRFMTYFQAALFAGLSFGPAIGGAINSASNYETTCFAAAGICVVNLICVAFFLTESKTQDERDSLADDAAAMGGALPCAAWTIMGANFIQAIGFTAFESLSTIYVQESYFAVGTPGIATQEDSIQAAASFSALVISGVGVVGLIVNLFLYNRIIPITGLKGSIFLGGVISACCFISMAIPINKWIFFATVQVFIFGENIMGTSVQTIITVCVHPAMFGKAIGMMTLCGNFARAFGPFIFAPIYDLDLGDFTLFGIDIVTAHCIPWFCNCFLKLAVVGLILTVKVGQFWMQQGGDAQKEAPTESEVVQALQKTISRTTSTTYRTAGLGLLHLTQQKAGSSETWAGVRRTVSVSASVGASMQENLISAEKASVARTQSVP